MTQDHNQLSIQPEKYIARRDFLKMAAAMGGSALALSQFRLTANAAEPAKKTAKPAKKETLPKDHPMRPYDEKAMIQAKTFDNLSTVEGISQNQLEQHLGLYKGYVSKINDIESQIHGMTIDLEKMNATYSPYRELHAEQTYALNGVVLHEYYFENMGGPKKKPNDTLMVHKLFTQEFGSWDNYVNHLLAVGKSARGWAITAYNMRDHRIHNYGLDLHNQGVPMHVMPLLVLDVYEHAYMIDFGTKRPAYLEAFMSNVNWAIVDERLKTMILHG